MGRGSERPGRNRLSLRAARSSTWLKALLLSTTMTSRGINESESWCAQLLLVHVAIPPANSTPLKTTRHGVGGGTALTFFKGTLRSLRHARWDRAERGVVARVVPPQCATHSHRGIGIPCLSQCNSRGHYPGKTNQKRNAVFLHQ